MKHPQKFRVSDRDDARLAVLGLLIFENDQGVVIVIAPLNLGPLDLLGFAKTNAGVIQKRYQGLQVGGEIRDQLAS